MVSRLLEAQVFTQAYPYIPILVSRSNAPFTGIPLLFAGGAFSTNEYLSVITVAWSSTGG